MLWLTHYIIFTQTTQLAAAPSPAVPVDSIVFVGSFRLILYTNSLRQNRNRNRNRIGNEQIRHALLLQPDHFCWAGKEILTELRSLITDIRLDLKDAAETEANLDVYVNDRLKYSTLTNDERPRRSTQYSRPT